MTIDLEQFHIVDGRGRELTRLNGDVMVYVDAPLREFRDALLACMERFFDICPRSALGWYATETMTQFKPVTSRTFAMPGTWWKDGAPRKPLRQLTLKGGDDHASVPTCGVYLSSAEREDRNFRRFSNYVRFVAPAAVVASKPQVWLEFATWLGNQIPFVSGHAGYVLEANPYHVRDSEAAAFPLAMRHQAVDIATMARGPWSVRRDRIKNVGWLTLIGAPLLERLGGVEELRRRAGDGLRVVELAHGVLLQAGERPILGDVNRGESLAALVAAYAAVQPLHAGIEDLFAPFSLAHDTDEEAATRRWLFRFRREPDEV